MLYKLLQSISTIRTFQSHAELSCSFVPEGLTWSLEWGQRGADLSVLALERQPSSVTHSHSQTSFMCKLSLDLLFTRRAFKYLLEQVINVSTELEICSCVEEMGIKKTKKSTFSSLQVAQFMDFFLCFLQVCCIDVLDVNNENTRWEWKENSFDQNLSCVVIIQKQQ